MNGSTSKTTIEERRWFGVTLLTLGLLAFQLVSLMRAGDGLIGHDYVWFLPRLVEGVQFFRAQGLSIPLYSPFFCGGFPYHADPQVMFYSLPQLLTLGVEPWVAIQITAVIFLFVGGISAYFCGRRVFIFSPPVSFMLACVFAANGFSRSRLLIGHLTYQAYPLIPLLVLALFYERLPRLLAVLILAGSFAYFVQSGGNYNAPIAGAAVLLCVPLMHLRRTPPYSEASTRAASALVIALGLCASKLIAGFAFSGNHPRISRFNDVETIVQAVLLVFSQLFTPGSYTPFPFGTWEYDSSVAPLLPVGWALAILHIARSRNRSLIVSFLVFTAALIFALQLPTGYANWAELLKDLPIINQMRVNIRFMGIVLFPLMVLAAFGFDALNRSASAACLVALSAFLPGEILRPNAHTYMDLPSAKVQTLWERAYAGDLNINGVTRAKNDVDPLLDGKTNTECYSVFFAKPPTRELWQGAVWEETADAFNFVKPACYVYPGENNCTAGARIPTSERAQFEALLSHRNPDWPVSRTQRIADMVSIAAGMIFVLLCGIVCAVGIFRVSRRSAGG